MKCCSNFISRRFISRRIRPVHVLIVCVVAVCFLLIFVPTVESEDDSCKALIDVKNITINTDITLDKERPSWSPWAEDAYCCSYSTYFTKGASTIALVSYPGSGNTWIRYILEGVTGIHTGSVYNDFLLQAQGYRAEMEAWNSGTTLLTKTHVYTVDEVHRFNRTAVLLIRNPYNGILAFHNFIYGGHTGYAPVSNYRRKEWEEFVEHNIKMWLLTIIIWLRETSSIEILHFEEIKQDPGESMARVSQFLNVPFDVNRLNCLKRNTDGHFRRQRQHLPDDLIFFNESLRKKIDRTIRYADYLLKKRNLTRIPFDLYDYYDGKQPENKNTIRCPPEKSKESCDRAIDRMNKPRYDNIRTTVMETFLGIFYSVAPDPLKWFPEYIYILVAPYPSDWFREYRQYNLRGSYIQVDKEFGSEAQLLEEDYNRLEPDPELERNNLEFFFNIVISATFIICVCVSSCVFILCIHFKERKQNGNNN